VLIYLLIQASVYGVVFYLPSQVAGLMGSKVGFMVGPGQRDSVGLRSDCRLADSGDRRSHRPAPPAPRP
jgi:hypothetical protein